MLSNPLRFRLGRLSQFIIAASTALVLVPASSLRADTKPDLQLYADGKADAAGAIQSAVNQGFATLPNGTFRITKPIDVRSNQGLIGPGVIVVDFDSGKPDANNIAIRAQGKNIRLEDFTIQKPFKDGSYGVGVQVETSSTNVVMRNLDISGYSARYGIHVRETDNFEITGCYIHDFMMNADSDMIDDSPAGLRITRCRWGVVSNNRVFRIEVGEHGLNSISPIKPKYGPQHYQSDNMTIMQSQYISITGNVMEDSGEGIDMLLSSRCTLTGNIIRDIWNQGIKMLGVSYCTVTGNSLLDCFQGIGLDGHKQFNRMCEGNVVTGNSILYSTELAGAEKMVTPKVNLNSVYGIVLRGETRANLVSNNNIEDLNTTAPVMKAPIYGGGATDKIQK